MTQTDLFSSASIALKPGDCARLITGVEVRIERVFDAETRWYLGKQTNKDIWHWLSDEMVSEITYSPGQ